MHCSADLTDERARADTDDDESWDRRSDPSREADSSGQLLAPDGIVDDTLTAVVGIAGGIVVGVIATFVLVFVTGSGWSLVVGFAVWMAATAYLVRRRTVQGAVAKTCYAIALVFLSIPFVALSPTLNVDGGLGARGGTFLGLLIFAAIPAIFAAGIGWVASRFVPTTASGSED
jgi:hypothetical protein